LSSGLAPAFLEGVKVPAVEPGSPVLLRFQVGGTLQVQVLGKGGEPVDGLIPRIIDGQGRDLTSLYAWLSTFAMDRFITDGEGRTSLEGILPGEYVVSVGSGPTPQGRRVSITSGQTSRAVLTLEEEESD
jgi:hypothetical protein